MPHWSCCCCLIIYGSSSGPMSLLVPTDDYLQGQAKPHAEAGPAQAQMEAQPSQLPSGQKPAASSGTRQQQEQHQQVQFSLQMLVAIT